MGLSFGEGETSLEEMELIKQRRQQNAEQLKFEAGVAAGRAIRGTRRIFKGASKGSDKVGFSVGQFSRVAMRPRRVFSEEQEALHSQFGGGDRFWGLGDESDTRVQIHNDLNPSQRGDFGTAEMFGF